jgi:hypothetical protein
MAALGGIVEQAGRMLLTGAPLPPRQETRREPEPDLPPEFAGAPAEEDEDRSGDLAFLLAKAEKALSAAENESLRPVNAEETSGRQNRPGGPSVGQLTGLLLALGFPDDLAAELAAAIDPAHLVSVCRCALERDWEVQAVLLALHGVNGRQFQALRRQPLSRLAAVARHARHGNYRNIAGAIVRGIEEGWTGTPPPRRPAKESPLLRETRARQREERQIAADLAKRTAEEKAAADEFLAQERARLFPGGRPAQNVERPEPAPASATPNGGRA